MDPFLRSDPKEGIHLMKFQRRHLPVPTHSITSGTQTAADSAAVWHLFDAHPLRWLAATGGGHPRVPRPSVASWSFPPIDREIYGWSGDRHAVVIDFPRAGKAAGSASHGTSFPGADSR